LWLLLIRKIEVQEQSRNYVGNEIIILILIIMIMKIDIVLLVNESTENIIN